MKAIVCEMCSSNDVVKQGDYYVCQSCGTKYEPEAARKLMVEIDNTAKIANLYSLARRAKNEDNSENAAKYYSQILEHNPNDWEAYFYSALYTAQNTTIANIASSANNLARAVPTSFELLGDSDCTQAEKESNAKEMSFACQELVLGMARVSMNELREYVKISAEAALKNQPEYRANMTACCNILVAVGDAIETNFIQSGNDPNGRMKEAAVEVWERAMDIVAGADSGTLEGNIAKRIRKYNSDYEYAKLGDVPITDQQYQETISEIRGENKIAAIKLVRKHTGWSLKEAKEYTENVLYPAAGASTSTSTNSSGGGCYVATAVYGSYDCPQVWTLRRYRDYELAKTARGRAFIRAYYTIIPHVVKWFGNSTLFKKFWRGKLDAMVKRLSDEGFENTPYLDRNW